MDEYKELSDGADRKVAMLPKLQVVSLLDSAAIFSTLRKSCSRANGTASTWMRPRMHGSEPCWFRCCEEPGHVIDAVWKELDVT